MPLQSLGKLRSTGITTFWVVFSGSRESGHWPGGHQRIIRPASAETRRDLVNRKDLFGSGVMPGTMKLVKSTVTESFNIIATYERAGPLKTGEFDVDEETGSMDVIERNKAK
jgi:hypothetical protein